MTHLITKGKLLLCLMTLLLSYLQPLYAQKHQQLFGRIDEFDCRIDSFILNNTITNRQEFCKYSYTKQGALQVIEHFIGATPQLRTATEKISLGYNDQNIQNRILTEQFDPVHSTWRQTKKEEKEFDLNHQITSEASYQWNEDKQVWQGLDHKKEYQYPNDRNQIITYSIYDDTSSQWIATTRTSIEQESDTRTKTTYYEFENNQFHEKSLCIYESSIELGLKTETFFDKQTDWAPIIRRVFTHNFIENSETETTEFFQNEEWIECFKQTITLNNDQEIIGILETFFDPNLQQWINVKTESFEKTFENDSPVISLRSNMGNVHNNEQMKSIWYNDQLITTTSLEFEDGAPTETNTNKQTFLNGYITNFTTQKDNNLNSLANWHWVLNEAENTIQFDYQSPYNQYNICYFIGELSKVPTPTIPDDSQSNIKIYPNPVIDLLNIELNTNYLTKPLFFICDLNGKQIIRGTLESSKTQVNLSSLGTGLYLLNIQHGALQGQSKVIIKK